MCVMKTSYKFKDDKHCLEATQLENKINELKQNKIKTQIALLKFINHKKKFRSEKHNV